MKLQSSVDGLALPSTEATRTRANRPITAARVGMHAGEPHLPHARIFTLPRGDESAFVHFIPEQRMERVALIIQRERVTRTSDFLRTASPASTAARVHLSMPFVISAMGKPYAATVSTRRQMRSH